MAVATEPQRSLRGPVSDCAHEPYPEVELYVACQHKPELGLYILPTVDDWLLTLSALIASPLSESIHKESMSGSLERTPSMIEGMLLVYTLAVGGMLLA